MDLLHETAVRMSHEDVNLGIGADKSTNRSSGEIPSTVERMTLPGVL